MCTSLLHSVNGLTVQHRAHACVNLYCITKCSSDQNQYVPSGNQCNRKILKSWQDRIITWTTKLRRSQSKNMWKWKSTLDKILSLTVEKLIWSLEVNRSTSLNQRQVKRLLIGTCSRTITHPSGTSATQTWCLEFVKSLKQKQWNRSISSQINTGKAV